jgi:serine/threonine protein kinase
MPDFPAEVKDLITRMLEVNPQKRLSIPLIKAHKAFRTDLPPMYNCPSPLPFPITIDPIDPATVDASLMETLCHLGFDQKEKLLADLQSTENTKAKIFYLILSNQMSMGKLPWQPDPDFTEDVQDSNFRFKPLGYTPYLPSSGEKIFSASATRDSVIDKILFSNDERSSACTCTTIEVGVSLQSLVVALHDYLRRRGFAWFYPNQWKILARRTIEDVMDIIFDIAPDLASLKLMVSLVQGPEEDYGLLITEIREVIDGIVP